MPPGMPQPSFALGGGGMEVVNMKMGNPAPWPLGSMQGSMQLPFPPQQQQQQQQQLFPSHAHWPQQQVFESAYQGFILRKAVPEPGQKFSWDRIQRTEYQLQSSDLNVKAKDARWKKPAAAKYDGLRTDTQRMHIDDLIAEQNSKEPNQFTEWKLADIEVQHRDIRIGLLQKATETSQIRVILKKVPRTTARPWDEGRPRIVDLNKSQQQPVQQPISQLQQFQQPLFAMPPPPPLPGMLGGGMAMPPPPQALGDAPLGQMMPGKFGGNGAEPKKVGAGKGGKAGKVDQPKSSAKNRRDSSPDRLDAKISRLLEAAGIDDSDSSSESDSDDSIIGIEKRHRKKGKHAKRAGNKARMPLFRNQTFDTSALPRGVYPNRKGEYPMPGAMPFRTKKPIR